MSKVVVPCSWTAAWKKKFVRVSPTSGIIAHRAISVWVYTHGNVGGWGTCVSSLYCSKLTPVSWTVDVRGPGSIVSTTRSKINFITVYAVLFHDLLLRSYLYHCVWSVITAHNLTPEKRDNNCSPHPLTPTSCVRNNIQLITGISPCCVCNVYLNTL